MPGVRSRLVMAGRGTDAWAREASVRFDARMGRIGIEGMRLERRCSRASAPA
jgi:hypothetical protein